MLPTAKTRMKPKVLSALRGGGLWMSKRLQIIVAATLLVAFLCFYANEIWRSSTRETHFPRKQRHAEHVQYESQRENMFIDLWKWTTGDPVSFYTSAVAFFTCALVIVSAIQIRFLIRADRTARISAIAAKQAANAASSQARDTRVLQRAYLSAEPLGINPFLGEGDNVIGHVSFRNVGHLPARDVSWFIAMEIDPSNERSQFPITDDKFFGNNVIAPGTPMTQGTPSFKRPKQGFIYVWGEVRYNDGFGMSRFTKFCHRYNSRTFLKLPERARYGIPAEYARYHEYGNDSE
jgi:hypothetical protein